MKHMLSARYTLTTSLSWTWVQAAWEAAWAGGGCQAWEGGPEGGPAAPGLRWGPDQGAAAHCRGECAWV